MLLCILNKNEIPRVIFKLSTQHDNVSFVMKIVVTNKILIRSSTNDIYEGSIQFKNLTAIEHKSLKS